MFSLCHFHTHENVPDLLTLSLPPPLPLTRFSSAQDFIFHFSLSNFLLVFWCFILFRERWKLCLRPKKCWVYSRLYNFWITMTSRKESSKSVWYSPLYEKELFEREISQLRLLIVRHLYRFCRSRRFSWFSILGLKAPFWQEGDTNK